MADFEEKSSSKLDSTINETQIDSKPKVALRLSEICYAWPKTTILIVGNEFCERFSYYGMRTVLTLYLMNILMYSESQSTIIYNTFTGLCYLTPLVGSIIADGYIGRFKTIMYFIIFYTIGQLLLAVSSIMHPNVKAHPYVDLIGLGIIAFGTGGIKPCVSAFGGDQFDVHQVRMIAAYFSVFYFAINAGSMISTFVAPIFRAMSCFGQNSCYPLAMGVPAVLMLIATIIFASGWKCYRKSIPRTNVFMEVIRVVKQGVLNRFRRTEKRRHFLDHYLDTHDCAQDSACRQLKIEKRRENVCAKRILVKEVKSLLRVLVMFLPIPVFWSLYDQQGTTWVIQGVYMDCRIWGTFMIPPDQMQFVNACLILILIPIFQFGIYPVVEKFVRLTPLRKMCAGGFVAALAYIACAIVQFQVDKTMPILPKTGHSFLSVINAFPDCTLTATIASHQIRLEPQTSLQNAIGSKNKLLELPAGEITTTFQFEKCSQTSLNAVTVKLEAQKINFVHVSEIGAVFGTAESKKPTAGNGEFSLGLLVALKEPTTDSLVVCRYEKGKSDGNHPCDPSNPADFTYYNAKDMVPNLKHFLFSDGPEPSLSHFKSIRSGDWRLYYTNSNPKTGNRPTNTDRFYVFYSGFEFSRYEQGGVYLTSLSGDKTAPTITTWKVVEDNQIRIFWQIPQITLITAAEVLISITGNEFSYTQAPPSLKSIAASLFLLTVATGDQLISLVKAINFIHGQAYEFLFWCGFMLFATLVLGLLSYFFYEYVDYSVDDEALAEQIQPVVEEPNVEIEGQSNLGLQVDESESNVHNQE
ncbi:Peptide transporter family 1 [Aphelenchoides besseyi]|nr:Peptide transporter family 1 [Aphelenchoides besseyi]KAI6193175.1 Peptide transporter family 1 [Aphelenchoides besseyi]